MRPPRWFIECALAAMLFAGGYVIHKPAPSIAFQVAHADTQHAIADRAPVETALVRRDHYLTRIIAKYDTVRDTLRLTDTVQVRAFVRVCDELKSGCVAYRDTARALLHHDSTVFVAQQHEIAAALADRPSRFRIAITDVAWFAAGRISSRLAPRVSLFNLTF